MSTAKCLLPGQIVSVKSLSVTFCCSHYDRANELPLMQEEAELQHLMNQTEEALVQTDCD